MGYWKSRVLPQIKKVFDTKTSQSRKAAAADACKAFDESKEEMNKELEEKKEELQPKVVQIYEACTAEIKAVVKAPTTATVKKHSALVNKVLEELAKIDFPGSKLASESSAKFGPALVSTSVFFVFEKVATFLPAEPAPVAEDTPKDHPPQQEETPPAVATEGASAEKTAEVKKEETEPVEVKKDAEPTAPPPPSSEEATTATPGPCTEEPAPVKAEPAPAKEEPPETGPETAKPEGGKA